MSRAHAYKKFIALSFQEFARRERLSPPSTSIQISIYSFYFSKISLVGFRNIFSLDEEQLDRLQSDLAIDLMLNKPQQNQETERVDLLVENNRQSIERLSQ